jgi:hypothetical protein
VCVFLFAGSVYLIDYSDTSTLDAGFALLGVNTVCFVVGFLLQSQFVGQGLVAFGQSQRVQLVMLMVAFFFLLITDQLFAGVAGHKFLVQVCMCSQA